MLSNKLRGAMDKTLGYGRELLGEIFGSEEQFEAGQRQRLIGELEADFDLSHTDAVKSVDQTLQ